MALPPVVDKVAFAKNSGGAVGAGDPRLERLLEGASAAVRRYCRWHVTPEVTETLVLDGPGGDLLVLPTLRLVEVTAITVQVPGEATPTALAAEDYEWSANGEVRRLGGYRWPTGFRSINVTMVHGYDDTPDVAQVVQQVVAHAITSPLGATREQAGAVSITWAQTAPNVAGGLSLLQRDLAVLDLYRLP